MLSYPEALERLLAVPPLPLASRRVPLAAAAGRILAETQLAAVDVPPHDNSAMDGYALRLADLPQPGVCLPVSQRIAAGQAPQPLLPGSVARVMTGAPLPPGADAVLMQEDCQVTPAGVCIGLRPPPGAHIRRAGSDVAAGARLLDAGTCLAPQDLALAAAAGLASLPVRRRLRVALFSTGDELHPPGTPLPPGGIYAANAFALVALLAGMGCVVEDLGRLPDALAPTRAALVAAAAEHDLIISSGGVSVGEEDHVKAAVAAEGRIDLWRVAMRPGRPLALGRIGQTPDARWFIGLPGNPVSAFVTFVVLARHLVARLQGRRAAPPRPYALEAGFAWEKTLPLHEFLRVRRAADGRLECFANQDSSLITSLTWAEGLAIKPPGVRIQPGDRLDFLPFAELCR